MVQKGFGVILIIVIVAVILFSSSFFLHNFYKDKSTTENMEKSGSAPISNITNIESLNLDTPPLKLKSIGVNIDYYDSETGRAGDFIFTKKKLQFDRLFMGFGFVIPLNMSSSGQDKSNPQPTYIVPLGTPVRAIVDGVVANIPTLWSGDYSIQITTDGKMQKWIYEMEHIVNPKVKVGDRVSAGQVVGEVSNFNRGAPEGFGTVEIGILKGGGSPEHVCPFAYLDESVKDDIQKKVIGLYKAWEEYKGDETLYDENIVTAGCLTLDPIKG